MAGMNKTGVLEDLVELSRTRPYVIRALLKTKMLCY